MAQVSWTEPALSDLMEVADYIASQSPDEARTVVQEALAKADSRKDFAASGAIVPEFDDPAIREVLVKDAFRLIYEVREENVFILTFIRFSRRLGPALINRRP